MSVERLTTERRECWGVPGEICEGGEEETTVCETTVTTVVLCSTAGGFKKCQGSEVGEEEDGCRDWRLVHETGRRATKCWYGGSEGVQMAAKRKERWDLLLCGKGHLPSPCLP